MHVFNVTGMTCAHCERAVTQAIKALDPQARVEVDLAAGTVRVEGTPSEQQIRAAIEEEGYQVR
ncbi:heavy-metal-associated domain-containing protein [Stutzerimonas balearica]|jgi:copper chaperone|uniref:Heavy-metal-associated domain-containing protein n=1 Tax=Stutzerimonas balearica TaxID=74829 RepID=A0A9X7V0V3_9GAMM|nr:cation transporter [Stutzerimonas balearica]MBK3749695.1 copper resistance protein CopZ [Stutzerimonas balearica]MBK3827890.1 copper resistance protein CopZ [Stutzerimonas balearica]MBK3857575.1 copper resistance protein CopZ [Stutzerimonas balearica]MBS4151676.1 copper chaperone [Stutzerimonas balearica]MCZ4129224.1 cation transporter [Stutzerimonas balearica]